ncbi:MAG: hypothetical protein DCC75_02100 [Proteobacteria bacterium]|nr:MAG: hypothetical protein DCC75_02100 [Pseudomonadota bacterium]
MTIPGHFVRAQGSGGDPNAPHQNRAPKASAKASAFEHAIHGMQERLQIFILLRALSYKRNERGNHSILSAKVQ